MSEPTHQEQPKDNKAVPNRVPAVSEVFPDGSMLEMLYCPLTNTTRFAKWQDGKIDVQDTFAIQGKQVLVPYSPDNNLLKHRVILFPSEVGEYGSEGELVAEIRSFIHQYVDLTPFYETVAAYYVLFSWVYDGFRELPYLRVKGDPGCGKTRFLLIIGSICYKPIFTSGASTMSPIFRMLDTFKGTLVIDESDFRMSDEKAEMVWAPVEKCGGSGSGK
jgi:hypothetical protein